MKAPIQKLISLNIFLALLGLYSNLATGLYKPETLNDREEILIANYSGLFAGLQSYCYHKEHPKVEKRSLSVETRSLSVVVPPFWLNDKILDNGWGVNLWGQSIHAFPPVVRYLYARNKDVLNKEALNKMPLEKLPEKLEEFSCAEFVKYTAKYYHGGEEQSLDARPEQMLTWSQVDGLRKAAIKAFKGLLGEDKVIQKTPKKIQGQKGDLKLPFVEGVEDDPLPIPDNAVVYNWWRVQRSLGGDRLENLKLQRLWQTKIYENYSKEAIDLQDRAQRRKVPFMIMGSGESAVWAVQHFDGHGEIEYDSKKRRNIYWVLDSAKHKQEDLNGHAGMVSKLNPAYSTQGRRLDEWYQDRMARRSVIFPYNREQQMAGNGPFELARQDLGDFNYSDHNTNIKKLNIKLESTAEGVDKAFAEVTYVEGLEAEEDHPTEFELYASFGFRCGNVGGVGGSDFESLKVVNLQDQINDDKDRQRRPHDSEDYQLIHPASVPPGSCLDSFRLYMEVTGNDDWSFSPHFFTIAGATRFLGGGGLENPALLRHYYSMEQNQSRLFPKSEQRVFGDFGHDGGLLLSRFQRVWPNN